MALVDATVILMKCDKTHKSYGVRVQKTSNGDWERTWAFPVDDQVAKKENYEKKSVVGNLFCTEEYPGCPYCHTTGFIMCGRCTKLTCYRDDLDGKFRCEWCGATGVVQTAEDKFNLSGNSF